jgi:hypothetical protein
MWWRELSRPIPSFQFSSSLVFYLKKGEWQHFYSPDPDRYRCILFCQWEKGNPLYVKNKGECSSLMR